MRCQKIELTERLKALLCFKQMMTAPTVLVLLHGWGADGHDLASLGEGLHQMMPDIALWCPHGPAPCSANPMGRQWFELSERFFQSPEEALPEMETTADVIEAACEALCDDLDLPPSSDVIGGLFSRWYDGVAFGHKWSFRSRRLC